MAFSKITESVEQGVVGIRITVLVCFYSTANKRCAAFTVSMRFGKLRNLILRTLSGSGTNWSLFVVKRPGGVVSRAASEHIRSENLQNIQQETWDVGLGVLGG